MLKRFIKSGTAPLKLAGLLAVGTAVHAALPYLPLVGPPPLRFAMVKHALSDAEAVVQDEKGSKVAPTNASSPTANASASNATVVAPFSVPVFSLTNPATASLATTLVSQSGDFSEPLADGFSPSVFALPTPDLLGITPQTLATYFHPVHFDTNAAIVGPFPLTFIPPMPADKSSHAEYIIK